MIERGKKNLHTLLSGFTIRAQWKIEVQTMNGNPAKCVQLIAGKDGFGKKIQPNDIF